MVVSASATFHIAGLADFGSAAGAEAQAVAAMAPTAARRRPKRLNRLMTILLLSDGMKARKA
jgi:hypothetical protein